MISPSNKGVALNHDKAGHREVHVKDHWVVIYRTNYRVQTIVIVKIGSPEKALGSEKNDMNEQFIRRDVKWGLYGDD